LAKGKKRVPRPFLRVRRSDIVNGTPVGRAPWLRTMPSRQTLLGAVSVWWATHYRSTPCSRQPLVSTTLPMNVDRQSDPVKSASIRVA
jgi:hypothetical protein